MKSFLSAILVVWGAWSTGDPFYDLSFTAANGNTIKMSTFKGKRVILIPVNGVQPDWGMLKAIDSIVQLHPDSTMAIAFPAMDFDSAINMGTLQHIYDSLGLRLIIAQPGYVKLKAGHSQLTVFQWLTHVEHNTHFSRDVEGDGQLFVVSAKGILYGILDKQNGVSRLPMVLTLKTTI